MKAWLNGFQFGPLRWQFSPEWWEKERAKGKARFVAHAALTWSFTFVGLTAMLNGTFDGTLSISVFKLIFCILFGVPIGLSWWCDNEGRYKKALREAGLKVLPPGQL